MSPTNLGARIRAFRKQAGLSQRQLAESLGVQQSTVCMWERDDYDLTPKLSMLERVATECGVGLQFFMFGPLPEQPSKGESADAS